MKVVSRAAIILLLVLLAILPMNVSALVYSEGFDGVTTPPTNWTELQGTWAIGNSFYNSTHGTIDGFSVYNATIFGGGMYNATIQVLGAAEGGSLLFAFQWGLGCTYSDGVPCRYMVDVNSNTGIFSLQFINVTGSAVLDSVNLGLSAPFIANVTMVWDSTTGDMEGYLNGTLHLTANNQQWTGGYLGLFGNERAQFEMVHVDADELGALTFYRHTGITDLAVDGSSVVNASTVYYLLNEEVVLNSTVATYYDFWRYIITSASIHEMNPYTHNVTASAIVHSYASGGGGVSAQAMNWWLMLVGFVCFVTPPFVIAKRRHGEAANVVILLFVRVIGLALIGSAVS